LRPSTTPKARILVVDNDPWIPRMAATILGQAGYLVNVAGDVQGALASAVKVAPRAILSTVTLPAVDGRPWWERLRAIVDARVIPFVFLIGPSGTAHDVRGFIAGLDECLAKPFRVEDLAQVVRTVVARSSDPTDAQPDGPDARRLTPPPPARPSQWLRPLLALRGVMSEIGLASLLVMLEMERKSGILVIESDPGTARLFLRKGYIIRADVDAPVHLSGAPAIYDALSWTEGQFEFLIGDVGGIDEIQASTTFLLMEAARRVDEAKMPRGGPPPGPPKGNR
jgi:two-component system OmpR family response regulator